MKTLVVAPHPDDEALGVGGTLLKRKAENVDIAWIIVTRPSDILNWDENRKKFRQLEIERVADSIGIKKIYNLDFPTALIDQIPIAELTIAISNAINDFNPDEVFIPAEGDVHTDHQIIYKACVSATKSFRNSSIKKILIYETLSETNFGDGKTSVFSPNMYIDITPYLEEKIKLCAIYTDQFEKHPFPRSIESIKALAIYRGSSSGFYAAEAFSVLKIREDI